MRRPPDSPCPPDRLSLLDRPLSPAFELRTVAIAPGGQRAYVEDEWLGTLVVVERGELELESVRGGRHRFACGAVLWLVGLPLRGLRNSGPEPVLLAAVSRRAARR